ncbi:MAG: hypothetical protein Q9220_003906 [cf. Caloplaca sp. 1 TL-2023]
MKPSKPVPFAADFIDVDDYIESMLSFVTSSALFQDLCGGVHVLDFFTQLPDLYTNLLPEDWRRFFESHVISDILDLFMRENITVFTTPELLGQGTLSWRNGPLPPTSLVTYINSIRALNLDRTVPCDNESPRSSNEPALAKHIAVGMKPKKKHEVASLARYVNNLSSELASTHHCQMSHFVDFGSGQNYLGRTLASAPYHKKTIAIESKPLNIEGARSMDITAKLAKKEVIKRNKKEYRNKSDGDRSTRRTPEDLVKPTPKDTPPAFSADPPLSIPCSDQPAIASGNIHYIQSTLESGFLAPLFYRLDFPSSPNLMVMSLHSCGNLLHHGLRSLILNSSVRAVVLVGCCYNLLTERLVPSSQPANPRAQNHPRLASTSTTQDPHGFPMSDRFVNYPHPDGQSKGITFNITARMMAVQAPQNWTQDDCESFFTRHFYRALFQKILVDKGVVIQGPNAHNSEDIMGKQRNCDSGESSSSSTTNAIILGSLRKAAYTSFLAYVRAAIAKLLLNPLHHDSVERHLSDLSDQEIEQYGLTYAHRKKELSIVWSLMAFSAQVVESAIVVDRWQWLREQEGVGEGRCWVQALWDMGVSPRNLAVVGVKEIDMDVDQGGNEGDRGASV